MHCRAAAHFKLSAALQKHLEHLEEAQNELMLVDEDDTTRFLVGECFLHIGNEDADNRISRGVQSYLDQRKLKGLRANVSYEYKRATVSNA